MKKLGKSVLYLTIFILVIMVIILIGIIINLLNKNKIESNEKIAKEQLGETTTNNAYITLKDHNSELDDIQNELNNMQNTAGQATATASQILKNYTAYKDGKLITGTMVNRGAWTNTPTTSGKVTIPEGYHNGSGYIDTSKVYTNGYNAAEVNKETLVFTGSASYSTFNTTSGGMTASGTILNLQLPTEYTKLTINSYNNCQISLSNGLLIITATGSGSSGVYGNGKAHGPSITFSYNITVSAE